MRAWLALLLLPTAVAQAQPQVGPWFDRAHSGHGIDIQRNGDIALVTLYSYDSSGEPEWFAAQGTLAATAFEAPLQRFGNLGTSAQPRVAARTVGAFALRLGVVAGAPPCDDGVDRNGASTLAAVSFSIDGESHAWCMEPMLPLPITPERAMDGTWFGGADDSGWGLTTYFLPGPAPRTAVQLLYFYDAAGAPRWSIAQDSYARFVVDARWVSYRGYCRACAAQPLLARDGGRLALSLTTPMLADGLDNRLELAAVYPGATGGQWNRDIRLQRISGVFLPPHTAATREGLLLGAADEGGTQRWRGIPFAAPPLADLRLRAPQAAASRQQVLDARDFGPGCPQAAAQGFFAGAPPTQDEDCLTLNVWAPDDSAGSAASRPVMVWIHGGGHVQGGSAQQLGTRPLYDGSRFARQDMLFVSINYRLGALGYGVFRELLGEHPDQPGAGNYGLLDQIAALRWVRDNISQFGGDPARVTIFGESAGGVSVCALLASPLARGLFQRAIIQSGNCTASVPMLLVANGTREPAVAQGERIKQRLGCAGADARDCLRARPVAAIVEAAQGATGFAGSGETYGEVIDGHALIGNVGDALRDGSAAQVALMIGVNEDEATTLIPVAQRPQTVAAYEALVRARAAPIAGAVLAQYPAAAYVPLWRAWTAINSDVAFICPAARAARDHAARGNPVFAYYLTQTLPNQPELGAFHGLDIPLLFSAMADYDPALQALAARMTTLWVAFARSGVPSADGVPAWPLHPAGSQAGLELNAAGISPRSGYRDAWCDFWARYVTL